MRSLVLIVLLVLAGIAGYNFINKPADKVADVVIVEDVTAPVINEEPLPIDEELSEETVIPETADTNMTTPADMPEDARQKMYASMAEYNKCMMHDKVEYHQANADVKEITGKAMQICEPKLNDLEAILTANHVNEGLREGMARAVQQRAIRQLMGALMQSQATDLMAKPAAPSTTP